MGRENQQGRVAVSLRDLARERAKLLNLCRVYLAYTLGNFLAHSYKRGVISWDFFSLVCVKISFRLCEI